MWTFAHCFRSGCFVIFVMYASEPSRIRSGQGVDGDAPQLVVKLAAQLHVSVVLELEEPASSGLDLTTVES